MSDEKLQKTLRKKIHHELQEFKKDLLEQKKSDVITNAYMIVCIISIYEELQELISQMNRETLIALVGTPGLLQFFYDGWLQKEDSFQQELRSSIILQIPIAREYMRRTKVAYEKIGVNH